MFCSLPIKKPLLVKRFCFEAITTIAIKIFRKSIPYSTILLVLIKRHHLKKNELKYLVSTYLRPETGRKSRPEEPGL